MSVDPRRIIIGAGTEYLYRRLFELFKKGVTFGIEDTGFKKLAEHADKYNSNAVVIRTDKEGMDIEELDATDATIAYLSPSNRFPTGRIMSIKKRLELFAWAYKDDGRFIAVSYTHLTLPTTERV